MQPANPNQTHQPDPDSFHCNDVIAALPAEVPFVSPYTLEQQYQVTIEQRLGANENQLGVSPKALTAIQANADQVFNYGDPEATSLKAALASRFDVSPEHLMLGCGIDELLGIILRVFCNTGDTVVATTNTYPTFFYHAKGYGLNIVTVDYNADFRCDLQQLVQQCVTQQAKVLYLANPDNPSGTFYPAEQIEQLRQQLMANGTLLLLDEAYIDFAIEPQQDRVQPVAGVIRCRTFSKLYGMAGLRIGYAIGPSAMMAQMNKVRLQYGMNNLALVAAEAALDDSEFAIQVRRETTAGQVLVTELAAELGLKTIASTTNFINIQCHNAVQAKFYVEQLLRLGCFIRQLQGAQLSHCIRISIGRQQQMEQFAQKLRQVQQLWAEHESAQQ